MTVKKIKKLTYILAMTILFLTLSGCQKNSQNSTSISSSTLQSSEKAPQVDASESSDKQEAPLYPSGSLLQAVTTGDLNETTKILSSDHYNINEVNEKAETALMIAVHNNQIDIAKQLIDAGADVNSQDTLQDSPYLYAGAEGRTEILAYILAHATPDQSIVNRFGGNALIPAAEKGHLENVKLLSADKRVNINHQNNYGYTALIEAIALRDGSQVYQDIVAELLRNGADPTIVDNYGKSAIDYAHQLGYQNISNLLTTTEQ